MTTSCRQPSTPTAAVEVSVTTPSLSVLQPRRSALRARRADPHHYGSHWGHVRLFFDVSRRAYATSSSDGCGGLSLGDLAMAFQQMGSGTTEGIRSGTNNNNIASTSGKESNNSHRRRPRGQQQHTLHSRDIAEPTSSLASSPVETGRGVAAQSPKAASKAPMQHHTGVQMSPHQIRFSAERLAPLVTVNSTDPPFLTFSTIYASYLASLGEAQLCSEVESQLGRRHMGCMLQCVHEVVDHRLPEAFKAREHARRITRTSRADREDVTATGTAVAAARLGDTVVASSWYSGTSFSLPKSEETEHGKDELRCRTEQKDIAGIQRNHRLLTAVLRLTTLASVYATEREMSTWLNSKLSDNNGNISSDNRLLCTEQEEVPLRSDEARSFFFHRLAQVLLQWLSCEVSYMDAHTSLQALHLLAQQDVAWSDAVLATLVDTIEVHLAHVHHTATAAATRPFTLEQYSLLLDTMARFQGQQMTVIRLQSQPLPSANDPPHTSDTPSDVISSHDGGLAQWKGAAARRALAEHQHPVANAHLFNCVTEALTRELTVSTSTSASIGLLHVGTATVLFLTRALSKLHWWNNDLMAALTPLLTRYLQRHSEPYAGVVMLVGRGEANVGDAPLLYVLLTSLLGRLRRRRSVDEGKESTAAALWGNKGSEGAREVENDEEDAEELALFSLRDQGEVLASTCGAETPSGSPSTTNSINVIAEEREGGQRGKRQPQPPPQLRRPSSQPLSLVDLHNFPAFLESLVRFYLRTVQSMVSSSSPVVFAAPESAVKIREDKSGSASTITRDVLQAHMHELFTLLQDDFQRSIPSLEGFATTTAAPLLAQLLHALITVTEQLQLTQQQGVHHNRSKKKKENRNDTNNNIISLRLSPLMVELAYVWTLQISRLPPPPLPPRDGRASPAASDAARFYRTAAMPRWQRAVRVHHLLISTGLLQRTRSSFARPPSSSTSKMMLKDGVSVLSNSGEDVCGPGRFFMPDEAISRAPRVQAAVEAEKRRLCSERQRTLRQLLKDEEKKAQEKEEGGQHRSSSRHNTYNVSDFGHAPRFASARIQGPSSQAQQYISARQRWRTADRVAALKQPVRSSDVFAKYSKTVSRLL